MREIHDQYSEIAPESEKLKGRKHRRSGVSALPLAVCAFFAAGMFLHPYISVSGKAATVQAESLSESNAYEDREVIAETEESRTQAEDIPEEESSTVHEESTQPETGLIEESTAPEETSSESTAEITAEETDTETVPETQSQSQQETVQTLPSAETQPPQTETAPQETATEALPTESASQEENQTDPFLQTEADAVPLESISESYAPDGSLIGTEEQADEESRAQSVTDGTVSGKTEPSDEGTIKESSRIPEESQFDTGDTQGQDTWESDASGTMGADSDPYSTPTEDPAAGGDSGDDDPQEPDDYEPDVGTDLYYLESEPSDYEDNP